VLPHPLVTYHDALASQLPLADKSVDLVTTFDVLEHCAEKDVPQIMAEFARVARRAIVARVAYRQAGERSFHGEFLHLTVRPEEWWLAQLGQVSRAEKWGEYLVGHLE
jgi:ubiquinone/menaquinone biosynthesis C-methylase UbiE